MNDKFKFWVNYHGYKDLKKYRLFGIWYEYSDEQKTSVYLFGIPIVSRYDYSEKLKKIEQRISMLQNQISNISINNTKK